MTNVMKTEHRLLAFVRAVRQRESLRIILTGLFWVTLALVLGTLVAAGVGLFFGFTDQFSNLARAALAAVMLMGLLLLVLLPIVRLVRNRGVQLMESVEPQFDGRIQTYFDTADRTPDHPFLPLVAGDALEMANRATPERIIPTQRIVRPVAGLLATVAAVLAFVQFSPHNWRNAATHLWWGWQQPGLVTNRALIVEPGNTKVLQGRNVAIVATVAGFDKDTVELFFRSAEQEWESTVLGKNESGQFDFTVFRLLSSVEYYVSAGHVTSDEFSIEVVEPARLERIQAFISYPEWTRLSDETIEDATVVSGVINTEAVLTFTASKPMDAPFLMLGEQRIPLVQNGLSYVATITLQKDSHYQLFDHLLDQDVPISSEHAVILRGDKAPDVKFVLPARDVSASPIEEVTIGLQARDDFAIEGIELLYSVNAGEWESVDLGTEGDVQHMFYLEKMGKSVPLLNDSGESGTLAAVTEIPLEPGDLISYYARVKDHDNVVETDMLLIDVRPFERRFREGQSGGGGGGGGSAPANEGSEISRRQKEILLATWNMIRATEAANGDPSAHADNAELLAELQITLADQAQKLADRSEARELVQQGEKIRQFVDYLRQAAVAMSPSAQALKSLNFDEAIQPQQKALQLLQRAEALFADIQVSQQQGQGGGGQSQPGKDMAEMFELEMDLTRNQYEQPDRGGQQSPSQKMDDIFKDLADLARRQQELAELQRNRREQPNAAALREEKWKQAQLQRDLQKIRELIEEAEKNAEANPDDDAADTNSSQYVLEALRQAEKALEEAQAEQQSRDAQQQSDGSSEDSDAEGQSGEGENSGENSDGGNGDGTVGERRASDAAAEQLDNAARRLAELRLNELQQLIEQAVIEANVILEGQRDTERSLRDAVDRAVRSRQAGDFRLGLNRTQARALAAEKRDLQRLLDSVASDVNTLVQRFSDEAPRTTEALTAALRALEQSQASIMLGYAADAIEDGAFATVLPGESLLTNSLREWRDRLSEAIELPQTEGRLASSLDGVQVADALRQLQEARRQLEVLTNNNNNENGQQGEGQQGEGQQGEGQQGEGQQGEGQQGEGQQGEGQQGEGQQGQGQQGQGQGQGQGQQGQQGQQLAEGDSAVQGGTGSSILRSGSANQSGVTFEAARRNAGNPDSESVADALEAAAGELSRGGTNPQDLDSLRDQVASLRERTGTIGGVHQERVEAEYQRALQLVEKLELELVRSLSDAEGAGLGVRDTGSRPAEISESASDYYRRLSKESGLTQP